MFFRQPSLIAARSPTRRRPRPPRTHDRTPRPEAGSLVAGAARTMAGLASGSSPHRTRAPPRQSQQRQMDQHHHLLQRIAEKLKVGLRDSDVQHSDAVFVQRLSERASTPPRPRRVRTPSAVPRERETPTRTPRAARSPRRHDAAMAQLSQAISQLNQRRPQRTPERPRPGTTNADAARP